MEEDGPDMMAPFALQYYAPYNPNLTKGIWAAEAEFFGQVFKTMFMPINSDIVIKCKYAIKTN